MRSGQLLSVREVAKLLAVSTATVYRLVAQNRLPSVRVGSVIRIHLEDVRRIGEL